jgi:hypothetical protein
MVSVGSGAHLQTAISDFRRILGPRSLRMYLVPYIDILRG